MIRAVTESDLADLVALAERRRMTYERAEPLFWRRAAGAVARQRAYFARLLASDRIIALLDDDDRRLAGFLIGSLIAAPPVYNPGGPICLIDDFVLADHAEWSTVGAALLARAREVARQHGAVATVVIAGHHDTTKRAMLAADGAHVVSEWWLHPIPSA